MERTRDPHVEVLLTGATGFLGKVVLHELLRRREELGMHRVHVLVRGRRDCDPRTRLRDEILASPCLSRLPERELARVGVVAGDLAEADCGLADASRAELSSRVTHVIHCAASVEFHLPIARALRANVTSALHTLELARSFPRLASMVAVSTAYVTPHPGDEVSVEERLAALPEPAESLAAAIAAGRYGDARSEARLLAETGHPNTYTLTKCIAEHRLVAERGDVPLSIVRPSIIAASQRQPFAGWIDSPAGFALFAVLIGSGHMRAVMARRRSRIDLVPVDAVADRVIAAALEPPKPDGDVPIRHAVAGYERSPSLRLCRERVSLFFERNPVSDTPPARMRYLGPDGPLFRLAHWLHHRRGARSSFKADRLAEANRRFAYFTHHSFRFRSSVPFDEPGFDPGAYLDTTCRGVYRHLLDGDESTVTLAGRRHDRHGSNALWVLRQPRGNAFIRLAAYLVDRTLARCAERVSVDVDSFRRALADVPEGATLVLAPSHRSYLDFVLCSYLCFARPDLGIAIPHVAAAVEFARIPLLGRLLRRMHAFYLERGRGREDKRLTRQVQELVASGATLEFFIEGQRSRSRRFLEPRRGLLRSLQATGRPCALLPVAISYERVPEEADFVRELAGAPKPPMRLRDLLGWTARMAQGRVELGCIHIACGRPVALDLAQDVHAVGRKLVGELQRATVATEQHLRAFLEVTAPSGVDLDGLRDAIRRRGGRVLEWPRPVRPVHPLVERTFRCHFEHRFHREALALLPGNPAIESHVRRNGWSSSAALEMDADAIDRPIESLVHALFDPVGRVYVATAAALEAEPPGDERPVAARDLLARVGDGAQLPDVDEALADLALRGILVADGVGSRFIAGPRFAELASYREACSRGIRAEIGEDP